MTTPDTTASPPAAASAPSAEIALPIVGMTCASCVNRIDRFLRKADGVAEVSVNLATELATIRYLPDRVGATELAATIAAAGYEVPAAALAAATATGDDAAQQREAADGGDRATEAHAPFLRAAREVSLPPRARGRGGVREADGGVMGDATCGP